MGVAADKKGTAFSMIVPLCFFVVAWTYALAVNFWPWYKNTVDAFSTTEVGLGGGAEKDGRPRHEVSDEEKIPAVENKTVERT